MTQQPPDTVRIALSREPPHVLMVSDDAGLGVLAEAFTERGFVFEHQRDLRAGLERALGGQSTLVMLDNALLDGNALDVIHRIRLRSWAPLVMLAANMDRAERIASIEAGADDCWLKPLDRDEVLARAHALLRRSGLAPSIVPERIAVNGITVDAALRRIVVNGREADVTSLEYDLLEYIIRAAGRIVSREELMAVIVQREASPLDRALDVHISRLRKKLGGQRTLIRTVRGVGYLFCP